MAKKTLLIFICLCLCGCEIGYYTHLMKGQLHLIQSRTPVEVVYQDPKTPDEVRKRLQLANITLEFAQEVLQLEVNNQYQEYVALEQPYVLWSLSAAPPLSLSPYQWCYPMIGCASYRGYFDRDRGIQAQKKLESKGYETYLRGVSAYSTLGWFDDPILSSFINYPDDLFANLLIHELAHVKLYVKGNTMYNESFATFVAEEGIRTMRQRFPGLLPNSDNEHQNIFKKLVLKYKLSLKELYESERSNEEKYLKKEALFNALRAEFMQLSTDWPQKSSYGKWLESLNNAKIMVYNDYETLVPFFRQLYSDCQQNWGCFYNATKNHHAREADANH